MSSQTRGLGRGLGALIPEAGARGLLDAPQEVQAGEQGARVISVPINDIIPNPHQPRTMMAPEALAELAASIREHGIIQPVIVARASPTDPAPFQLIAGERRWRAAQIAGLATVPVLVKEATSQQALELALVENIQRADLNPLEEAAAYQALVSEFGMNQQTVADRVGKSRVAVANVLRLLRLPDKVKTLLAQGTLSEGHARALLGLPDDDMMMQAAGQVVARQLTVRQTEELVRRLLAATEAEPDLGPETADDPNALQTHDLEDAFRSVLGTKVSLTRGRRGGKLVIHFYSEEELQSLYEQIVGQS